MQTFPAGFFFLTNIADTILIVCFSVGEMKVCIVCVHVCASKYMKPRPWWGEVCNVLLYTCYIKIYLGNQQCLF